MKRPGAIVTDIEGTTTPISFVTETLFPYARGRLNTVCAELAREVGGRSEGHDALALLRAEYASESEPVPPFGDGAAYAHHLMDQDRKSTGLKKLQGLIWAEGYRSGALLGELFDDVEPALQAWQAQGIRLGVFSSGSVLAQKLLFGHTRYGDLTPLFSVFHDTTTGAKREVESYRRIAHDLGPVSGPILFLSDVVEELDAAHGAEYETGLLIRPGNRPTSPAGHPSFQSFSELVWHG